MSDVGFGDLPRIIGTVFRVDNESLVLVDKTFGHLYRVLFTLLQIKQQRSRL